MTISFNDLPAAIGALHERLDSIEYLIRQKNEINIESDEILTIEQAAEFIHKSRATIYGLVHNLQIPFAKNGNRLYFNKKELTSWLMEGRRKTIDEIKQEADQYLLKKKGVTDGR